MLTGVRKEGWSESNQFSMKKKTAIFSVVRILYQFYCMQSCTFFNLWSDVYSGLSVEFSHKTFFFAQQPRTLEKVILVLQHLQHMMHLILTNRSKKSMHVITLVSDKGHGRMFSDQIYHHHHF